MAHKIYGTNKARESHIKNIDRLLARLASSEECVKGIGYHDFCDIERYLRDLRKATEMEMS